MLTMQPFSYLLKYQDQLGVVSMSFHIRKYCFFTLLEMNLPPTSQEKKKNQSSRVYFCSYPFPVKISSYNHVFDFSKLHHIILSFLISSFLPVLKKSVCLLSYIGAFTCALDPSLPYCLTSLTLKSISFTNNIP